MCWTVSTVQKETSSVYDDRTYRAKTVEQRIDGGKYPCLGRPNQITAHSTVGRMSALVFAYLTSMTERTAVA